MELLHEEVLFLKLKEALEKARESGKEKEIKEDGYYLNSGITILPVESYEVKGWILTYYNPDDDKVIQIVVSDDIVVKEAEHPMNPTKKELDLKKIKTNVVKMLDKAKTEFLKFRKPLSQVIITVQETDKGATWKFNFITKTLEIVIIEISALTGEVISSKLVALTK